MSKIKKIFAENFMAHENSEAVFDESGILNFCGRNASGKTAFTMIPEIIGYNAYESEQKKYIKDGKGHYHIGIEFDDGVTITQTRYRKVKSGNGRVLWKAEKNGKLLYSNKINDSILNVEGVPDDSNFSIKKYMNLVIDEATGEELNVRRRNNKLMFIDTSGGENYTIFNSILGCENIRSASEEIRNQTNEYREEITSRKNKLPVLEKMMDESEILPDEVMNELKENIQKTGEYVKRIESITDIKDALENIEKIIINPEINKVDIKKLSEIEDLKLQYSKIKSITVSPKINTFDTKQISDIEEIKSILSQIKNIKINPELKSIDNQRIDMLTELKCTCEKLMKKIQPEIPLINTAKLTLLEEMKKQYENLKSKKLYNEVQTIDYQQYNDITELQKAFAEYKSKSERFEKINTNYKNLKKELTELADKNSYKICQNCGAVILMEEECE